MVGQKPEMTLPLWSLQPTAKIKRKNAKGLSPNPSPMSGTIKVKVIKTYVFIYDDLNRIGILELNLTADSGDLFIYRRVIRTFACDIHHQE